MKKIDYLAVEHAKKHTKSWDNFIVAAEAYGSGYQQATEKACSIVFNQEGVSHWEDEDTINLIREKQNEEIKYEIPPGEQQLSNASFLTWQKQKESMSFKHALKTFLPWLDFTDLRVVEKDGIISFMGVAKRGKD